VESLLGEAEDCALETSVPVFLGVDVESLLGEEEVSSLETRVPVPKGRNF